MGLGSIQGSMFNVLIHPAPTFFSTNHQTTAAGGAGADASAVGATPIATITGHQGPVWQVGLVIVEWCGWMDGWMGGWMYI